MTGSYTPHWEAVRVEWNDQNSYQIIKELKCQGETFDCFDNQQGTNVDSDKSEEENIFKI